MLGKPNLHVAYIAMYIHRAALILVSVSRQYQHILMVSESGCMLLYFVKSKNGTTCKNFAVFLDQYIHFFVLPKTSGRGAIAHLATSLNLPLVYEY